MLVDLRAESTRQARWVEKRDYFKSYVMVEDCGIREKWLTMRKQNAVRKPFWACDLFAR